MSEKGKDWKAVAKKIREKAVWWRGGQTFKVYYGDFVLTPTKKTNPQTGKEYETQDYTVKVQLPNGKDGYRKVPSLVLAEIVDKAESEGKDKDGELVEFTRPAPQGSQFPRQRY